MRLIALLVAAVVIVIALWLVFANPRLIGGPAAPTAVAPTAAPPAAKVVTQTQTAEDAAQKAKAAAKAKAEKAAALAAERAAEAAKVDALEQNMTAAQNRLNEDYAAQVGDTRPAASDAGAAATPPN